MALAKFLQPLILGGAIICALPARAKVVFNSSEIEGQGATILFPDLTGNGLADAMLIDGTNVAVFFQDPKLGFKRQPQVRFHLPDRPSVVWTSRLGSRAENLLVMTSEGVSAYCVTNAAAPPACEQIIKQRTIIPEKLEKFARTRVESFTLSAKGASDWPLILALVPDGIQIWRHAGAWRQAQFIPNAVNEKLYPSVNPPGYDRTFELSLSLAERNRGGPDDLMVMRNGAGGMQVFTLYHQNAAGLFDAVPALTYTNSADWRTTLAWLDINRDGKLGLIASTISDEPSFVPGLQSGKVLVAVYPAGDHGQIPAQPRQVFRKHDWSAYLPLVDIDGDGFADLALGYFAIDSRDGVRNMISAGKINLNLRLHFFRPGAGFPAEPDCQRNVSIYFDGDLVWSADSRIYSEKFLSLDGDFNGDGKKDLLARDRGDGISAYCFVSRETGFNERADFEFHCPEPMDTWLIKDLNGDGVSDLAVKLRKQNVFRIFLSHRE